MLAATSKVRIIQYLGTFEEEQVYEHINERSRAGISGQTLLLILLCKHMCHGVPVGLSMSRTSQVYEIQFFLGMYRDNI